MESKKRQVITYSMIASGVLLIAILSTIGFYQNGYSAGNSTGFIDGKLSGSISGNTTGYNTGYQRGYAGTIKIFGISKQGYENGYKDGGKRGWDEGIKNFITSNCDSDGTQYYITKPVSRYELERFINADQTDKLEYADDFNCLGFALTLKANASKHGIRCAVVILYFLNEITGADDIGHAINAFDTVDSRIVYVEPQSDVFRQDVSLDKSYSGEYYSRGLSFKENMFYFLHDTPTEYQRKLHQKFSEDKIIRIVEIWSNDEVKEYRSKNYGNGLPIKSLFIP